MTMFPPRGPVAQSNNGLTLMINDAELSSPPLICAIQNFGFSLGVSPSHWPDFQMDLYCNAARAIVCPCGREMMLRTELFEATDEEIDAGRAVMVKEASRTWFRMRFGQPTPKGSRVFLTKPNREKFRVTASILAAAFPDAERNWPRIPIANDNCPEFCAANDNF